jgi:prefoldin alpha subunit
MSTGVTTDSGGGTTSTINSGNTIQLDALSLEQLDQLKQREEQRLQALAQRYAALRQAAARLTAATTAVQELYCYEQPNNDGSSAVDNEVQKEITKDVFVPLTESVYVPGKINIGSQLNQQQQLLIELGTGYFVEQNSEGTVDFLQRKLRLVDANSDNGTRIY